MPQDVKSAVLFRLLGLIVGVITLLLIMYYGKLHHKTVETVLMLISFTSSRVIMGKSKSWHAPGVFVCSLISLYLYFLLIEAIPSLQVSILISVIYGVACAVIARYAYEIRERLKKLYELMCTNLKTMPINLFLEKCRLAGFTNQQTEYVVDALSCNRLSSEQELADKHYNGEIDSAKKQKQRLKKKLEQA